MSKLSKSARFYLIMGISLVIMILFGKLPPFGDMTVYGMQFLGVFLGCIFGWLLGVVVPVSLLGIIMAGLLIEGQSVDGMMKALQSTQMVLVVFWAFFFVYGLEKCGILDFLAGKIMSVKLCAKSPWHLAIALWICTMVCAGLSTQPFASAFLMFNMYYSVADKVGAQKASSYTSFVLVIMAAVASLSTGMVPYAGSILMSLSFMSAVVPEAIYNIPAICVVNFCVTSVTIILAAVLLKILMTAHIIRVEFDISSIQENLFEGRTEFDTKVKWGFFYILFLVVIMMLPTFLSPESTLNIFLERIGMLGMFVVVVALMSFTTINGEPLMDLETAIKEGAVKWQVYFMMGAALVISGQLVTEQAGLSSTIQNAVGGIAEGMSLYVLCLVFLTGGLILTNCITNTVAMQLVIPVLAIFMAAKGVNPAVITGLSAIVLIYGQILPSGSPLGAFLHGNVEWIEARLGYIYTVCAAICVVIAIAVIGIPLALFFS